MRVCDASLLPCVQLPASAQTLTVIQRFNGLNGGGPSGVTRDAAGNLYGTTGGGGASGDGTVFKLSHTGAGWVLTPLHIFNVSDGALPQARVVFGPDGALYGTTYYGGSGSGDGTVYRLQPPRSCRSGNCPWTETVLYSFQGGSDGAYPGNADLAFDLQGNIYGTTLQGGTGCGLGCGVVFKLTRSGGGWSYSVLYSFVGGDDGANPDGGVVLDGSGNLYGTTVAGGEGDDGNGIVFELTPSASGWTESVIHRFGPSDGVSPDAGLILDRAGNLYGTTPTDGEYDAGTVYELTPENGGWNFAVLASLQTLRGSGPGGKLAMDDKGNLYGATGSGLVFKLTPSGNNWILTQLGSTDPGIQSGVIVDSNGVIYGTDTFAGHDQHGTVFEVTQ
jgi:uncharacterized repeat protein (TIGR03803 family)